MTKECAIKIALLAVSTLTIVYLCQAAKELLGFDCTLIAVGLIAFIAKDFILAKRNNVILETGAYKLPQNIR